MTISVAKQQRELLQSIGDKYIPINAYDDYHNGVVKSLHNLGKNPKFNVFGKKFSMKTLELCFKKGFLSSHCVCPETGDYLVGLSDLGKFFVESCSGEIMYNETSTVQFEYTIKKPTNAHLSEGGFNLV